MAKWFFLVVGFVFIINGILALIPKINFIAQPSWYSWFQIVLGIVVAAYAANELSK